MGGAIIMAAFTFHSSRRTTTGLRFGRDVQYVDSVRLVVMSVAVPGANPALAA